MMKGLRAALSQTRRVLGMVFIVSLLGTAPMYVFAGETEIYCYCHEGPGACPSITCDSGVNGFCNGGEPGTCVFSGEQVDACDDFGPVYCQQN